MVDVAHGVSDISVIDLYARYPRHDIDVDEEQLRLLEHDAIVFQFPLYWYSTPSMLKEWQDLVLEHGFAYGEKGIALKDKLWLCAVTVGASQNDYAYDGSQRRPLRHLLSPLEATADLCNMPFLAPYTLFDAPEVGESAIQTHALGYGKLLEALRDDRLDLNAAKQADLLSVDQLDQLISA